MAEASLAVQGINKLRLELNHKDNELSLTKEKGKIGHFIHIFLSWWVCDSTKAEEAIYKTLRT